MQPDQIENFAPGRGGFVAFVENMRLPIGGAPRFGDVMSSDQRTIVQALAPCIEAVVLRQRPPKRGLWLEAVKGFGKDYLTALCILYVLAFAPWSALVQVGADDQAQGGELKRAIDEWLRANVWLSARVDSQRWRLVNQVTGACCEILTTDPTGAHGARPDMLVINEVSHIASETYAQTLADNFTKMPNAFAVFATNAGFLGTWPYTWRELYRQDPRWLFVKIAATPPWQSPEDIEEAKRRNPPSRFRRLFCGEWVAATGDALAQEDIDAAQTLVGPTLRRLPMQRAIITLDLGVRHDRAAMTVLLGDWEVNPPRIKLAWCQDWTAPAGGSIELERVFESIVWARRTYGASCICYDEWQAVSLIQRAERLGVYGIAKHFGGDGATEMANALLEVFRGRFIDIWPHPQLLKDLSQLSIIERPSGGYRIVAPRGADGHADLAISMCLGLPLAWQAIREVCVAAPPRPDVYNLMGASYDRRA
jgi:hypothetical protein